MIRFAGVLSFVAVCGCAATAPSRVVVAPVVESAPSPLAVSAPAEGAVTAVATEDAVVVSASVQREPDEIPDGLTDSEEDELDEASADEGESHDTAEAYDNGHRYTGDLNDDELKELWGKTPEALGSISIGFVDEGRIVNAHQFPKGEGYIVVQPEKAWATRETVEAVIAAIRDVKAQYPEAPPLRVNQISAREGGYLRPHKSHQNGRDVDLGFYYPTAEPIRVREREKYIDVEKNWALLKALVTRTDVQMILVDRRVQKVIYDHALAAGEDKAWLDSLFHRGVNSIVRHARRHRDHFHVRFYNARAQELGRRVAPLLAMRPEQNVRMHRVRRGDTLGGIAARYGTTVNLLKKANRLRSSFLRISQVLVVPLRGPCTRCPVPPAVVVPPRRLPPGFEETPVVAAAAVEATPGVASTTVHQAPVEAPASTVAAAATPTDGVLTVGSVGVQPEVVTAEITESETREAVAGDTTDSPASLELSGPDDGSPLPLPAVMGVVPSALGR